MNSIDDTQWPPEHLKILKGRSETPTPINRIKGPTMVIFPEAHIQAWRDKLIREVTQDFPPGHPFHFTPGPRASFVKRMARKLEWLWGLRIAHKDRIDQEEW